MLPFKRTNYHNLNWDACKNVTMNVLLAGQMFHIDCLNQNRTVNWKIVLSTITRCELIRMISEIHSVKDE